MNFIFIKINKCFFDEVFRSFIRAYITSTSNRHLILIRFFAKALTSIPLSPPLKLHFQFHTFKVASLDSSSLLIMIYQRFFLLMLPRPTLVETDVSHFLSMLTIRLWTLIDRRNFLEAKKPRT